MTLQKIKKYTSIWGLALGIGLSSPNYSQQLNGHYKNCLDTENRVLDKKTNKTQEKLMQFHIKGVDESIINGSHIKIYNNLTGELFGETTQAPDIEKINNTNQITFHITPEKSITKKGKFISILCNITNNSNQTIKLYSKINFHIEDLSRNITLPVGKTDNYLITNLKQGQSMLNLINPFNFVNYKDEFNLPVMSYPWPYVKEGKYRMYFSMKTEEGIVKSNEIEIEVLPLNEEEEVVFQQLINNVEIENSIKDYNNLFNIYKNSFYAEESYYLYGWVITENLSKENHPERAQIIGRLKEHLIKFPYSSESNRLMRSLDCDFDDCRRAMEEVIEVLKLESPDSWLLKIIEQRYKLKEELKR